VHYRNKFMQVNEFELILYLGFTITNCSLFLLFRYCKTVAMVTIFISLLSSNVVGQFFLVTSLKYVSCLNPKH